MPEYAENDLVRLLRAKDKTAFKLLYDKYSGALYSNILQIIGNKDTAVDILHDTFMAVWKKFDTYDETKGRLFTWMVTISRNLCIDLLRSRDYKDNLKNTPIAEEDDEDLYASGVAVITPAMNCIGLRKAILNLKPKYRDLIDMAYYRGFTQSEIAGMEGVPMGTIKTRIRKALLALREQLQ